MAKVRPSGYVTPEQIASFQNEIISSVNSNAKSLNNLSQQLETASAIAPRLGNRHAVHLKGVTAVHADLYVAGIIYCNEILPFSGLPK